MTTKLDLSAVEHLIEQLAEQRAEEKIRERVARGELVAVDQAAEVRRLDALLGLEPA